MFTRNVSSVDNFIDRVLAECLIGDVAGEHEGSYDLLFHEPRRFRGILMLIEIDDGYIHSGTRDAGARSAVFFPWHDIIEELWRRGGC